MEDRAYEKMNIQWFPGHMTKAQRMIEQDLKMVDAVCEILDARIPRSSRNPDIDRLAGDKPRLLILNRIDLADPAVTARWRRSFEEQGLAVLETDARSGKGVKDFAPAVRRLLKDKLADMTEDEQFKLLASDPMLVRRPILIGDDFVRPGFKVPEWEEVL